MAKKKTMKPYDILACLLCGEPAPEFGGVGLYLAHIREAHADLIGVDGKVHATGTLTQALDGRDWFSNSFIYRNSKGRKIAERACGGPRAKDDPMRYG